MTTFTALLKHLEMTKEQVQKSRERIPMVRQKLAKLRVTREAGGGLVKATVDGHKQLVKIEIDPSIIDPRDQEMLQDLIRAANNLAIDVAEDKATDIISANAPGRPRPLPDMKF